MTNGSFIQLTEQNTWQSWGVDVRAGYWRCSKIE